MEEIDPKIMKEHMEKLRLEHKKREEKLREIAIEAKRKLHDSNKPIKVDYSSLSDDQWKFLEDQPNLNQYISDIERLLKYNEIFEREKDQLLKKMKDHQTFVKNYFDIKESN